MIYRVPDALLSRAQEGVRVVVPVSSRKITGIIVGQSSHPGDIHSQKVKDILDIIDEVPIFSQDMKNVWEWIAHYYFSSSGAVLQTILPRTVRHQSTTSVALPKKKGGRKKPNTEDDRRKQLLVDRLKEGEKELLAYITEKKRASVKTLHRRFPQLATRETLQHLESLNLIRLAESFPRPRTITESNESIAMAGAYAEEGTHDSGDNGEQTQWDRLSLTSAQQNAQSEVENALKKEEFRVFLLHGVTGSGKTEVYLRAARYAVSQDKSALFLVPEIALTHQLVAQVRQRFGGSVAVLHSAMTGKERWDEWKRIARREIAVVVGARSAIFAPLMNLGLIVVDEEHETAYKQEDGIRYNARDIAIVRGKISSCPVILGSATPALESYTHSQTQHYTALTLPTRVAARPLPKVEIVDLRRESRSGKTAPIFSTRLQQALRATYQAGKQSVLISESAWICELPAMPPMRRDALVSAL